MNTTKKTIISLIISFHIIGINSYSDINNKKIYYDDDFKELNMTTSEYYDYLWNKYVIFNNNSSINNSDYKYNFIYNLKYHFYMKNKFIPNNFNFEYSFIPVNKKDYDNHKIIYKINKYQYENFNNLMTNYYNNMCKSHYNLCGNGNENKNVFKYIFNRMYKSIINFNFDEMINKIPNINKMIILDI